MENLSYEYHANKTHFHKKGFALGLVLRVRVFGTRKRPIGGRENVIANDANREVIKNTRYRGKKRGRERRKETGKTAQK